MKKMKQTFCLARATLLLLVMLCSIGAWADDYPFTYTFNEVTTGYETLNQAITAANENSGGTIKINAEGVYTLSGNINADLEIAASGVTLNVGQLTVSGQITVNGVQYDLSIGDDGVLNAQSVSGVQTCTISGGTVNANLLAFQEGTIENATINASIEAGSSTTITGSTIDAEKIVSLNASSDITFTNCNINLSLYLMFFGAVTFDVPSPGISIKVAEYDKENDGSLTIANGSLTDGANVYTGAIAKPSVLNNKTLTYYNEGGDPGTVTVTLNQQGGSGGTTSVTPTSGEAMPAITLPTRTGYTFDGYFTGTNGNGTQYYNADGSSATNWDLTVSTILYAKWTGNTYSVTLNRQGGSGGTESVTATFGSAMPGITPPIRDGYDFGGYYTGSNGEGTKYYTASGTSAWNWDIDQDTELFAKWTVKTYTVTLDRQGGNGGTASVDVAFGSAMPAITPPTMLGYDFCGYFTETNGNGTKYYDADGTSTRTWDIDAVTTLYAKWENISIEQDGITYEWTSGTNVKVAGCNGTLTSITIPASVNHNDVLYNVTEIGEEAFMDNISLMSIDLTNCLITVIRARAFKNCTNLSSVLLPASLTTIGDETFPTNANTTVTIADGLYLHNGDEVLSGDVTDMDKLNGKTLQPAIPYIKNGTTAYCTNFTVLDNTMTTLAGGWYVVNSDVTFSGNLSINDSGKVHIILCDGATLRANNITPIGNSDKLCIYGQSQGTGTANISGNIMGNYSVSIYGGTINVTGNITCAQGSIGIYGGTITAGLLQALNNGAQITLGGATVKANSYSADDGVTILPGITYYDGEGHGYNAGDLSADEIAAIAGKTLTPAIPYIDANGDTAYCTDFTELTSGGAQTLPGGWYVVNSNISRSGMQLFESDTHIILADDATMTITQDGNNLGLYSEGSLTIYGQTAGSGALNATSLRAIVADDNVTINGGNITANGTDMGATGYPYGIEASGNITLGWTKATDQIYASSYSGNVTIADGKTLYNGTEGLSGTINSDDFASKLNGKTLRTYDYRTVSYVKADGTTGSADAIPLTGGTDYYDVTLGSDGETTWYVVNSNVNYRVITLIGNVNIILCDDKTMTADGSAASAISGKYGYNNSLTIYGQSAGTGKLVAQCGEGNGMCHRLSVWHRSQWEYHPRLDESHRPDLRLVVQRHGEDCRRADAERRYEYLRREYTIGNAGGTDERDAEAAVDRFGRQ